MMKFIFDVLVGCFLIFILCWISFYPICEELLIKYLKKQQRKLKQKIEDIRALSYILLFKYASLFMILGGALLNITYFTIQVMNADTIDYIIRNYIIYDFDLNFNVNVEVNTNFEEMKKIAEFRKKPLSEYEYLVIPAQSSWGLGKNPWIVSVEYRHELTRDCVHIYAHDRKIMEGYYDYCSYNPNKYKTNWADMPLNPPKPPKFR